MSLYTPGHFGTDDQAAIAELIRDHPFATLVTPAVPEPCISHIPLLLVGGCEPQGMLIGHVARANPHWRHAGTAESIAIFHGPHAYVSPSWYALPAAAVPTWNYAAVHAHGTIEVIDDDAETHGVLDALVNRFESGRESPWKFAMPEPQRDAMVGAIVGFRLRIRRIEAKFKLSQNRSGEDRERVARALENADIAEERAVAAWIRRHGAARTSR